MFIKSVANEENAAIMAASKVACSEVTCQFPYVVYSYKIFRLHLCLDLFVVNTWQISQTSIHDFASKATHLHVVGESVDRR
jgi:hypothetical protein